MTSTVKIVIGGVVIAAVASLGYMSYKKGQTKAVEVRTEAVEARDLVASVTASGQIEPRTKVDVSADVTGKIVRLAVKEGDMVTKGQFLLQIDPEQVTAALQRAEAALASTQRAGRPGARQSAFRPRRTSSGRRASGRPSRRWSATSSSSSCARRPK